MTEENAKHEPGGHAPGWQKRDADSLLSMCISACLHVERTCGTVRRGLEALRALLVDGGGK